MGIGLITFAGVGLQNAVNVTDGLDGLAAGSVLISGFWEHFLFSEAEPSVIILSVLLPEFV